MFFLHACISNADHVQDFSPAATREYFLHACVSNAGRVQDFSPDVMRKVFSGTRAFRMPVVCRISVRM
jgi:hypothetical protein